MPQKKQKFRNTKEVKKRLKDEKKMPKKYFPTVEDLYGDLSDKRQ